MMMIDKQVYHCCKHDHTNVLFIRDFSIRISTARVYIHKRKINPFFT